MVETENRVWLKPAEIAAQGLIKNSKGNPADRQHIVRLIKQGKLRAKAWASASYRVGSAYKVSTSNKKRVIAQPIRSYYVVSLDEVHRYNREQAAY